LFERRSNSWARFAQLKKADGNTSCPLAIYVGPCVQQSDPWESQVIFICVFYIYGRVLMQFQKIVEPRPGLGGQTYERRGTVNCDVHTGELVPRFTISLYRVKTFFKYLVSFCEQVLGLFSAYAALRAWWAFSPIILAV
jgi:hypothetical protein